LAAGAAKPDLMGDLLRQLARAAGWIDAYYENPRRFPVLSRSLPGELSEALPSSAPEEPEPFERIFADFERLIVPGITHWNHPRFFAYFAISSAPIAVVAEALTAALDVNAMLWRTSPAATELEEVVLAWLRELLGLPATFSGIVYDTASISGFTALAAARESLDLDIRERGMAGRSDLPALRIYLTEHTHSHIEKAALALGVGRENVVRVPVDENFAMRPDELDVLLARDIAAGRRPMCIAATVGTTSTTSSDPVPAIAEVARKHGVWLHVDAAYAGPAAILPEFRYLLDGCERADSLVVNPHKWMFVPIDFSVLYVRDPEVVRRAFSLVIDILRTPESGVRNYMDYGLQLGRRFRALKFWFVLRSYGARGIRKRLREHIALAQEFAGWIEAAPGWEILAPHPLSVVCFRYAPAGLDPEELDACNARVVEEANAGGEIFISSTRLAGRTALRLAVGNEGTTREDVRLAWDVLRRSAESALAGLRLG
jgi:aromatic-L-amino-acid decarboxylase